jgi:hypothetical protein
MRYRFARQTDLATLESFISTHLRMPGEHREALPRLWQKLSADGRLRMTVIDDPELPEKDAVQAIAVSCFVHDAYFQEYLGDPRPGLASQVYERVLGGDSPVLTDREIRLANTGAGLHLVMLHFALRNPDLDDPQVQQLMVAVNAAFFFFYGGYRLRSAMQEVYGRQAAEYMQAGGFHIVTDFAGSFEGSKAPDERLHPYLLLLRKEQVQPSVVNPLSFLFYPVPPRIHFTPAEQKVLELALLNQSDQDICDDLGVSLDTVKKTWRRIFQRAARIMPTVMAPDSSGDSGAFRGVEKRRHLLDYVRIHLEELRPFLAE